MKMPGWPSEEGPGEGMDGTEGDTRSLTVDEVARVVGGDTPVEVIGECSSLKIESGRLPVTPRRRYAIQFPIVDPLSMGGVLQHACIGAG